MSVSQATPGLDLTTIGQAIDSLTDRLLAARNANGVWTGKLSSSALSTATAISALTLAGDHKDAAAVARGVHWLRVHGNMDGGWGDTIDSPSNLSTTLLGIAALKLGGREDANGPAMAYVHQHAGRTRQQWQKALEGIYGADRTFAVPILTNLALAGLVPWKPIPPLPWALAGLPPFTYKALRLHVVSYALPALIAIGLRLEHEHGERNLVHRCIARCLRDRAIARLPQIQPEHGGFLDAIPLTSFVAMALAGLPGAPAEVLQKCVTFLRDRQRPDGSWPIDTNLSIWLTTASVNALAEAKRLDCIDRQRVTQFLLKTQCQTIHPYTNAAPGGWAWTDLPGGVPDADDTSGAILALARLGEHNPMPPAIHWLCSIQNADGGFPTFCRGWGRLPFDQSAPDITAHAIRALNAAPARTVPGRALKRAMKYLERSQLPDGSWSALWFGSQFVPGHRNPVFGTARVLRAFSPSESVRPRPAVGRAIAFLLKQQNADGGWGAAEGIASTVEETAQAVGALARWRSDPAIAQAANGGVAFLLQAIAAGGLDHPAPIGLYFASLWYSETLYPTIWTLEALGRTMAALSTTT